MGDEGQLGTCPPPSSPPTSPRFLTDAMEYPGHGSAGELLVVADGEEVAHIVADLALPQLQGKGSVTALLFLTPNSSPGSFKWEMPETPGQIKEVLLTSASLRSSSSFSSSSSGLVGSSSK